MWPIFNSNNGNPETVANIQQCKYGVLMNDFDDIQKLIFYFFSCGFFNFDGYFGDIELS